MGTTWCPYTDADIDEAKANREHIIPLSLGGANGFEIPVDASTNSKIGSELDGALANDFLTALQRTEYDARGHSGKEPIAILKATYGEEKRPAYLHFHKKRRLRVWDARDREFKQGKNVFNVKASLSLDLPVRFTAKVALSAGYYVYGDLFRTHVDHRQLRDVMRTDPAKLDLAKGPTTLGLDHLTLLVDNYMHKDPTPDAGSTLYLMRTFCSAVRGSVVVLAPTHDRFMVAVGILGKYLAMVNVPAKSAPFPHDGAYNWGHVVAVIDKRIRRFSFASGLETVFRLPPGAEGENTPET